MCFISLSVLVIGRCCDVQKSHCFLVLLAVIISCIFPPRAFSSLQGTFALVPLFEPIMISQRTKPLPIPSQHTFGISFISLIFIFLLFHSMERNTTPTLLSHSFQQSEKSDPLTLENHNNHFILNHSACETFTHVCWMHLIFCGINRDRP